MDNPVYRIWFDDGMCAEVALSWEVVHLDELGYVRAAAASAARRAYERWVPDVRRVQVAGRGIGEWIERSWEIMPGLTWPGRMTAIQTLVLANRWPAANL